VRKIVFHTDAVEENPCKAFLLGLAPDVRAYISADLAAFQDDDLALPRTQVDLDVYRLTSKPRGTYLIFCCDEAAAPLLTVLLAMCKAGEERTAEGAAQRRLKRRRRRS